MRRTRYAAIAAFILSFTLELIPQDNGTQVPPKSDVEFIKSSNAKLISSMKLKPLNTTNPFERQIQTETSALDAITNFATQVFVCHGCGTNSHPTLGIIADVDQLASIKERSHVQQFPAILRFLLAHEKTHQIQYRQYSASIIDLPEEDRQVYEAQADILGAKYLMESMQGTANAQETQATVEALRVAYDLGVEQYSIADHPSHESRLTAVRLGMAAGMITKMQQLPIPEAQGSIQTLVSKLDIRAGETVMDWSLRTAKRVVNYRRPAIVGLVLIDEQVNFNRAPNNPVVTYQLTYENRDTSPIGIDLEVQCIAAPRENTSDIFGWQKIDANDHHFTLAAKAKQTIKGTMHWEANANLMPVFVAPPKPTALIQVQYVQGSIGPQASRDSTTLNAESNVGTRESLGYVLGRMLQSARSGFLNLRAGPGRKSEDLVIYPANPQFPGAAETNVWIPEPGSDSEPYVYSVIYAGTDDATAAETFKTLVGNVQTELHSLGQWRETSSKDNQGNESSHDFSQPNARVTISKRKSQGQFKIAISIRPS